MPRSALTGQGSVVGSQSTGGACARGWPWRSKEVDQGTPNGAVRAVVIVSRRKRIGLRKRPNAMGLSFGGCRRVSPKLPTGFLGLGAQWFFGEARAVIETRFDAWIRPNSLATACRPRRIASSIWLFMKPCCFAKCHQHRWPSALPGQRAVAVPPAFGLISDRPARSRLASR